jgi:hypothetical protein
MPMRTLLRRIRSNLLTGIGLGLFVATGFTAWITFLRLSVGTGPFDRLDTTYSATVALYYAGGLVGGFLVGLLLPLKRTPWGAALLGMIGVFPLYFGVELTQTNVRAAFTLDNVATSAFLSFLVGGAVGMWVWLDDNPDSTGVIEALRHPTGTVVAKLWAFAVVIAGVSYLVLPRWTGSWHLTLVLFVAFVSFVIPLGLATIVTFAWIRPNERS